MPKLEKAERRERRRRKAISDKFQNVRYRTLRAGQGLLQREVARTTKLKKG